VAGGVSSVVTAEGVSHPASAAISNAIEMTLTGRPNCADLGTMKQRSATQLHAFLGRD
jgi:hypothetical protein